MSTIRIDNIRNVIEEFVKTSSYSPRASYEDILRDYAALFDVIVKLNGLDELGAPEDDNSSFYELEIVSIEKFVERIINKDYYQSRSDRSNLEDQRDVMV